MLMIASVTTANMIPCRGSRLARIRSYQLHQSHNRNLSSISRIPSRQRNSLGALSSSRTSTRWRVAIPVTLSTLSATRNASTIPTVTGTASPSQPPTAPVALDPSIDTITLNPVDQAAQATEGIGYLHSLGIDYGWGPTSMIQWVLEQSHYTLGLPWWAAIFATGVGLRLAMVPLFIRSADSVARQAAMVPLTKPLTDDMWRLRKEGKQQEAMIAMQRISQIRKQAGVSAKDMYTPILIQGIIGFCGFKLMRAIALLPVPGMENGGFLWITDLTQTDPFLITPVLMGLAVHSVIRMGGESGSTDINAMNENLRKIMMYGMPGLIMLTTVWQPAALCLWFMSTGVVGLTQGLLLQRPGVRKALGIAPVYKSAPGQANPMDEINAMFAGKAKRSDRVTTNIAPETSKDSQYMQPQYQAPRVVDAKLVNKSASTASTATAGKSRTQDAATGGVLGQVKGGYKRAKDLQTKWMEDAAEKQQQEALQRREERAYEERTKRLQQRKKR